jgi:shikimate kinase
MKQSGRARGRASGKAGPRLDRAVVLVGLMGAGKSTVGRRLAKALGAPFTDADAEIEKAAGLSIADIFSSLGEAEFRAGERRVIARLLDGAPRVLATGGGAFMDPETRALIRDRAVSIWLKADIDVLMKRVMRRDTRPLLRTEDPRAVMEKLMAARHPVYAEADIVVDSADGPHEATVKAAVEALETWAAEREA